MDSPHLIPLSIARRWALARHGFRSDVAGGCWRKGLVAVGDEAIDDPGEGLWGLLWAEEDVPHTRGERCEPVARSRGCTAHGRH
jgi:hypothetical protein